MEIVGWDALCAYLGICYHTAISSSCHRGLPKGRKEYRNRAHYLVWSSKDLDAWKALHLTK